MQTDVLRSSNTPESLTKYWHWKSGVKGTMPLPSGVRLSDSPLSWVSILCFHQVSDTADWVIKRISGP